MRLTWSEEIPSGFLIWFSAIAFTTFTLKMMTCHLWPLKEKVFLSVYLSVWLFVSLFVSLSVSLHDSMFVNDFCKQLHIRCLHKKWWPIVSDSQKRRYFYLYICLFLCTVCLPISKFINYLYIKIDGLSSLTVKREVLSICLSVIVFVFMYVCLSV